MEISGWRCSRDYDSASRLRYKEVGAMMRERGREICERHEMRLRKGYRSTLIPAGRHYPAQLVIVDAVSAKRESNLAVIAQHVLIDEGFFIQHDAADWIV